MFFVCFLCVLLFILLLLIVLHHVNSPFRPHSWVTFFKRHVCKCVQSRIERQPRHFMVCAHALIYFLLNTLHSTSSISTDNPGEATKSSHADSDVVYTKQTVWFPWVQKSLIWKTTPHLKKYIYVYGARQWDIIATTSLRCVLRHILAAYLQLSNCDQIT